jgi:hypothetical protein
MAAWRVDSYFINVGIGDGAIHLLVQNNAIVGSVLIDGGMFIAAPRLAATIKEIKKKYNVTPLSFNSIVVTHWDDDHYLGLVRFLMEDVYEAKGPNPQPEYIQDGKTIFYYPYTGLKKEPWKKFCKFDNDRLSFQIDDKSTEGLCAAVASTRCIGYDFFTGRDATQWSTGINLKLLANRATIKDLEKAIPANSSPLFLCVGADNYFINEDIPTPETALQKDPKKADVMNASSIMCLVMWPPVVGRPPRVSLYTGGDAEEEQEEVLVKWMGAPNSKAISPASILCLFGWWGSWSPQ